MFYGKKLKMKQFLNSLCGMVVLLAVSTNGYSQDDQWVALAPEKHYSSETMLVTQILERYHYRKTEINDSLSSVILDNYLSSLDPNRVYFLQSDVASFESYRYQFDDYLQDGELEVPYKIFNVFRKRFMQRSDHIDRLLETKFDFNVDEYYNPDRSEMDWPATIEEQNELWRKVIKGQLLNLKLADKELGEALSVLHKRYSSYRKAINQYTSEDVYQQYMNSFSESYDPHTTYFSPISSENFMINQSLSLEGIGARLGLDGDYTIIADIVAGGPAFKSNRLHENDKIIGVAQENDEKYTDVVGWRVTDVVQLIRGPKGSIVRLQIIPAGEANNSRPEEVRLVRDKIKLEDEKVTQEIIPYEKNGLEYKLGVITVPSFYMDFEEYRKGSPDYNSTSRDVKKILTDYKAQNVDGVLIDLRRNGGGSLQEAIELSGLFIKEGPMVQVRNTNGGIESGDDPDPEVVYDGPLTVLTNRFSASASEIFAGAIQDYDRGVIIGEQTYGKGTVQNLIGLDRFLPDEDAELGQLKLTIAKYYRVNGSSTQHLGVRPDIELPSAYSADIYGESSKPSSLPWDQIASSTYESTNKIDKSLIDKLRAGFENRRDSDPDMQDLIASIEESKRARNNNRQSLQESKRKQEIEDAEKRRASRSKLQGRISTELEGKTVSPKIDDPYLKEGIIILADLIAHDVG